MTTKDAVIDLCEKLHKSGMEALQAGDITPFVSWIGDKPENLEQYGRFENQTTSAVLFTEKSVKEFHKLMKPIRCFRSVYGNDNMVTAGSEFPLHSTVRTGHPHLPVSGMPDMEGLTLQFNLAVSMKENLVMVASDPSPEVEQARTAIGALYEKSGIIPVLQRDVELVFITIARIVEKLPLDGYEKFANLGEGLKEYLQQAPLELTVKELVTVNLWPEMRR
ncbi:MAG: hypothetical protein HQ539_03090 [Parcubacteria group bacterium]|nr:hypothetical protein [Parcubacteria group bacterium]